MLKGPTAAVLAILLGAAFVCGVVRLLILRYEVGDVYPAYSSLRADPLGIKVLATALGEMPQMAVRRNYKPLPKLRPDGPVTLVCAGVQRHSFWTEEELATFDELTTRGSRAVFAFYPMLHPPSREELQREEKTQRRKKKAQEAKEKEKAKKQSPSENKKTATPKDAEKKGRPAADSKDAKDDQSDDESDEHSDLIKFDAVAKHWGLEFAYLADLKDKTAHRRAVLAAAGTNLEPEISWHSVLCFAKLKPLWKVLYQCGGKPVIISRPYGDGSIVLAADSFFLSNEALRSERSPLLIARLFSGPSSIVFDEEHNDLHENPGIAALARKYRLHGVAASLVLLAILFVWKSAARFIPVRRSSTMRGNDAVAGKDVGEGFVNLLRRSIRPAAIFEICLGEWSKSFGHNERELKKIKDVEARILARPVKQRDPVAAYVEASRALARHE